jgi:hypothetical protein
MNLVDALIGTDPMAAIIELVSDYWAMQWQKTTIAAMRGVFADNDAAPDVDEHQQGDLTYVADTPFSGENFIEAQQTIGDNASDLSVIFMHSRVLSTARKNNLIDYLPQSINPAAGMIPTFFGLPIIVDDSMPNDGYAYDTWIFGPGAIMYGIGQPKVPTEVDRVPSAGKGGGQEILYNRIEQVIHPVGHKYVGIPPNGGPDNSNTVNNLAHAASWQRAFPQRKQIKIARLITQEFKKPATP